MKKVKRNPILGTNNVKTLKSGKFSDKDNNLPYITYIAYLSPFTFNSKGINLCSHASSGCASACLVGSGNARFEVVRNGRLKRTEYFLSSRIEFLEQLKNELTKAIKKHEGKATVVVRLNGTSDIPYEKFKVFEGKNIFEYFSDIQFYDYTKNYLRFDKVLPSNYHLTFSRSENNHDKAMELLNRGFNVAMVMTKLVKSYKGFNVVNGDLNDLTFLHPSKTIVGLKYKLLTGKGVDNSIGVKSGFVLDTNLEYTLEKYNEVIARVKANIKTLELV
jgi:hypothetical protein